MNLQGISKIIDSFTSRNQGASYNAAEVTRASIPLRGPGGAVDRKFGAKPGIFASIFAALRANSQKNVGAGRFECFPEHPSETLNPQRVPRRK